MKWLHKIVPDYVKYLIKIICLTTAHGLTLNSPVYASYRTEVFIFLKST